MEFQRLDTGIAAHNRISGAICLLPSPDGEMHGGGPGKTTEPVFDRQAMMGLEEAGLFQKIRYPFPVPVRFSKTSEHVTLVCVFGRRSAQLQCPNTEILNIFRSTFGSCLLSEENAHPASDVIAVQFHGDGFGVYVNSRPVFGQCEFALARHFVMREMAISLAGREQVSASFHAGVVGTHDAAVVFAARSGSGKSTLTAAMAAKGFTYHCDDQCALVGNNSRISPFPTRIGLKSGSWALADLDRYGIGDIERTFMGDGHIKQVMPHVVAEPTDTPKISAFVFPAYSRNGEFKLTELSRLDALQQLFDSGTRLAGRYPTIRPLAETLATVPAFELKYGDTLPAMKAVEDLLAR